MNTRSKRSLILAMALGLLTLAGMLLVTGQSARATMLSPAATTRYVAAGGTNSGACTNAGAPCQTLQYTVDQAIGGDEIRVATGVYTGVQVRAGITQVVYISKTLTIRGGYQTGFGDWAPPLYTTTLDAKGQGRVIYVTGSDISVTLEHLHVTGGLSENGGGLYVSQSNIHLRHNHIYSNTAHAYGGGLDLQTCHATLEANTVQSNTVLAPKYYHGGGALHAVASELTLIDNDIHNNTSAERAGGIYLGNGNATLVGNTIAGNRGIGREGGGLHLLNGSATLKENTFRNNAAHWGGGVYANMGTLTLTHNVFVSNTVTVYSGGALSLQESVGILSHNVISRNAAQSRGGGIHAYSQYNLDASVTLDANLIRGNHARQDGGGVFVMGNVLAKLTNNVIADNQADDHGDGLSSWGATTHLLHNTLTHNGDSGLRVEVGSVYLTNTLFFSQTVGIDNAGGTVTATTTLWDSVVTPTLGTVHELGSLTGTAGFAADGYHLTKASDAVEAGIRTDIWHDIDEERRPMGGRSDIGADEYPMPLIYLPIVLSHTAAR